MSIKQIKGILVLLCIIYVCNISITVHSNLTSITIINTTGIDSPFTGVMFLIIVANGKISNGETLIH